MQKEKAIEIAAPYFENHTVDEFHITSDEQAFFDEHTAANHAQGLKDPEVTKVTKSDVKLLEVFKRSKAKREAEEKAQEEADKKAAAKAEADKKAKEDGTKNTAAKDKVAKTESASEAKNNTEEGAKATKPTDQSNPAIEEKAAKDSKSQKKGTSEAV